MQTEMANLGRVQGAGIFYTTSVSGSVVKKEDIVPTGISPLVGDCILFFNGDIRTILSVQKTTVLCGDVQTVLSGPRGPKGEQGEKGEKGDPFTVAKTFTSVAEMNAGFASDGVAQGSFVIIDTGNIEDVENAQLYLKGANGYVYITDLSGAKGIKGDKGERGSRIFRSINAATQQADGTYHLLDSGNTAGAVDNDYIACKINGDTTEYLFRVVSRDTSGSPATLILDSDIRLTGYPGADGATPEIRDGIWYIDNTNTGVSAVGATGAKGDPGATFSLNGTVLTITTA